MGSYARFGWMIACSTLVMFGLMYLNTLVMGAAMAIVMLGFMLGMYKDQRRNLAIFLGAGAVFAVSLWLVRSQATVDDGIPGQHRRHLG